jgi:CRP-like cAMP-binding protein
MGGKNMGIQECAHTSSGLAGFFTGENLDNLKGIMYPKKVKAGSYLFWEGDQTRKLYYIRSGRVKLSKSTKEGKDLILSIMQEGDLVGEIDGYGEALHSCSAEVIEDADIGVIQQKDLEILLYQHGDFAIQFMKWMSLKNSTLQTKLRDLLLFGKNGALASILIRMSNTFGVMCADGIRLDLKLSNTEMADLIGSTRESVNRMLSALKDEGTISMSKGQIIIHKLENLRRVCNCPSYPVCPKEICRL